MIFPDMNMVLILASIVLAFGIVVAIIKKAFKLLATLIIIFFVLHFFL